MQVGSFSPRLACGILGFVCIVHLNCAPLCLSVLLLTCGWAERETALQGWCCCPCDEQSSGLRPAGRNSEQVVGPLLCRGGFACFQRALGNETLCLQSALACPADRLAGSLLTEQHSAVGPGQGTALLLVSEGAQAQNAHSRREHVQGLGG